MSGKDKKGGKCEEKLDWESLGMNLDARDFNPAGERLASEDAEMNEFLNREIFEVRAAKIRIRSRIIDAENFLPGARMLSMFPVGQFNPAKMDALFEDDGYGDEFDEDESGELDEGEDSDGGSVGEAEMARESGSSADKSESRECDDSRGGESVMFSEADISVEDGRDVITYSGDGGVETKIIINRDGVKPIVTITRSGELNNTIVLEEGRRHISVYGLRIMPIEMAVYAKKVRVEFSQESGGVLELDYLVELRGLGIQRTRVIIEVEPVGAEAAE